MDQTAFETWLGWISDLNEPQRRRALQALASMEVEDFRGVETPRSSGLARSKFPLIDDETQSATRVGATRVAELGQRKVDIVGCPHCDSRDLVRWGHASALPRYRCKACSRTFNALTKTPLANLRMKDKWVD